MAKVVSDYGSDSHNAEVIAQNRPLSPGYSSWAAPLMTAFLGPLGNILKHALKVHFKALKTCARLIDAQGRYINVLARSMTV